MKALAIRILHAFSKRVIKRYHPLVVGVTGSYGKTSAKEAISAALSEHYLVRESAKSFNNEFGVPFTILGVKASGSGIQRILSAGWLGLKLLISRQPYPTVLVLEFGDDKPGDLKKLLKLVRLDAGVLTSIGPTHLEHFKTVEEVLAEESQIVTTLKPDAWAILNCDDLRVRSLAELAMCRTVSYGFSGYAAVRCVDSAPAQDSRGDWGTEFSLQFQHQSVPVFIPGVLGRHSVFAALAAAAVGIAFNLDLLEIGQGLLRYLPPPGRMRMLPGVKQTMLIDDTYNSSPDACRSAIESLRLFPAEGKRYAMLGEMADLGAASEAAHRGIAQPLVDNNIDYFVAVGEKMKAAAEVAKTAGMPADSVFTFNDPVEAARFVQSRLAPGDAVLLKGSQVARMEKSVKELMADPQKADQLLVRQEQAWLRS